MKEKEISNFIFEMGALKKFAHSGFKFAGVKHPDSIADHAFRAAIIAYFLARNEKHPEPEKIAFMTLLHDNGEARITDLHKIAARYINSKKAEMRAFKDQIKNLPFDIPKRFEKYFTEYEERKTIEGKIAKDADLLETAFQAKEYYDIGHKECMDWIKNVERSIRTESGKKLLKTLKKMKYSEWWIGLKKID